LEKARTLALELREDAVSALEPFGDKARRLREIADFIVLRKF
jgi:farnesyl diphosphate synthase